MKHEDCFELGYITKTHGLHGEVTIFIDADDPSLYFELDSVFLEVNSQLVPYFTETIHPTKGNLVLIKFEEIDNLEQANKFVGCKLFLPLTQLPELESDQYYFHQLIDFSVVDKELGQLGKITNVVTGQKQDLIVMEYNEKEVLIPVTDEVILEVDKEKETVLTNLPEGLLDVYME